MYQSYALQVESSSSSYFLILEAVESMEQPFTIGYPTVQESSMNQLGLAWAQGEAMLHSNSWRPKQTLKHNTG
jgi:hypothetical protein